MPFDSEGRWRPPTSPKQDQLRALCRQKKFVLANGTRFSTKTVGCLHAMAEHAWLTQRGNACILTVSQTVGYDSGIWKDFTDVVLPEWIEGNFGMEWHKKPWIMGLSKKPTCQVTNMHGGVTTLQLESLQVEADVEDRFKPRRYSMVYIPELSTFRNRNTFTTLTECLRVLGLPPEAHLFLADTNPSDEGMESWIYKVWFDLLDADPSECNQQELELKKNLARLDFSLEDNIFDPPERIQELISKYAHDPDLYARYVEGKWVKASTDALFYTVFRSGYHVVGEEKSKAVPDPELMAPEPDCVELYSGWDPGPVNCAACIVEQFHPPGPKYENKPAFKVLDELIEVGGDVDLGEFVGAFLKKMRWWEAVLGRKVLWTHISDRSVFDTKDWSTGLYVHQSILHLSGGEIELIAADRSPGSVRPGVNLMRMLLYDERLWINAATCPQVVEMFKSIKKGKSELSVIQKGSPFKHALDCLRYPLSHLCVREMAEKTIKSLRTMRKSEVGLVSVPI